MTEKRAVATNRRTRHVVPRESPSKRGADYQKALDTGDEACGMMEEALTDLSPGTRW